MKILFLLCFSLCLMAEDFVLSKQNNFPEFPINIPKPASQWPQSSSQRSFDVYGNYWTLIDGEVWLLKASSKQWQKLDNVPKGQWQHLINDETGKLVIADDTQIFRLNPSKVKQGWKDYSSLTQGAKITDLTIAPTGGMLIACDNNKIIELITLKKKDHITEYQTKFKVDKIFVDDLGSIWFRSGKDHYIKESSKDAWQRDWKIVARMPSGTHDLGGDVLQGKFYLEWALTGMYDFPNQGKCHEELLSFDGEKWKIEAHFGMARAYCGVSHLGNKIITAGGESRDAEGKKTYPPIAQSFDIESEKMSDLPGLPLALPSALSFNHQNRYYVMGYGLEKEEHNIHLFSIADGESQWQVENKGALGKGSSYGVKLEDKFYHIVDHKYLAILDLGTMSWTTIAVPNSPRSAAVAHYKGEIWIMSGRNKTSDRDVYIFSPGKNTFRKGPQLPHGIIWGTGFNLNKKLYITGGVDASTFTFNNATYQYRH